MSLTQEAWDQIIKGKFPDAFVRGRLAIRLERSDQHKAVITIMILDKEENIILFEYGESTLLNDKHRFPIVLTGAEVKTAIQIINEEADNT